MGQPNVREGMALGEQVVTGAVLQCTFGIAPGTLTVLPLNKVTAAGGPAANINDYKPMVNIATFGMCQSPSNPQVAAATAAAMGVLTPMPCIPMTQSPWTPGSSTVQIAGQPALTPSSTCMCMWGGSISITFAGQATVSTAD